VREDARKLAAKIRGEDVTYRDKRNVLEATRHQETTARKDKEFEESKKQSFLDRRSREKIAGMRKTGSAFNTPERIRYNTSKERIATTKQFLTASGNAEDASFAALQAANTIHAQVAGLKPGASGQSRIAGTLVTRAVEDMAEGTGLTKEQASRLLGLDKGLLPDEFVDWGR